MNQKILYKQINEACCGRRLKFVNGTGNQILYFMCEGCDSVFMRPAHLLEDKK